MLSCRIIQLRRSFGLNQLQLAQKLHLSPSTIGMYEQGRRTPSIDILIQMSRIFNVSLDYLITGSEFTPSSEDIDSDFSPNHYHCCKCCYQEILDIIRENMASNEHGQTYELIEK